MNTKDIEEIETLLSNLSFWNVLDTDEQCELRTTLTQHHEAEVEKAYERGVADGTGKPLLAIENVREAEGEKLRNKAGEATGEMLRSLKIDDLDYENKYEWYGYIRGVRDIVYTMNAQKNGECPSQNDLEEALHIIQTLTPTTPDKQADITSDKTEV